MNQLPKAIKPEPPKKRIPDPSDWQAKYLSPRSESNPSRFWVIPHLASVLDDLKFCGGRVSRLVQEISEDRDEQQNVLYQIHEELAKEENSFWAEKFRAAVTFGKRAQLGLGIDKALDDYRGSGEMNATLLSKLGAQAMPETFGNSVMQKAEVEKAAQEENDKAIEDHIADLE